MRIPKRLYAVYIRRDDGAALLVHVTPNRKGAKEAASSQEVRPDVDQIWTETFVHATPSGGDPRG